MSLSYEESRQNEIIETVKAQVSKATNAKNNNKLVTVKATSKKASSVEDRSFNIFLSDLDVLDSLICFDRLIIPVYQCKNGHIACSVCCRRIFNKCGSCSSLLISTKYCRALEKVLESVKVSCPNAKHDCDSVSLFLDLPTYFTTEYGFSASAGVRFLYDKPFNVTLKSEDETIIFQEDTGSKLFILHNLVIDHGNAVNVC
ncbi:E3 ubiquitin-protein ligase SINA-like 4 [Arachis hypogaea]|uniref:E3 ubiquitin-protein ligase SINA-like 4 n=1 Tax=Arachis hypogaea TaxID=3818 RepID=UPI000DEC5BB7|nr:E3 ubiquitin-protein ligase SINA-like 4 [Arachis hypogaea]